MTKDKENLLLKESEPAYCDRLENLPLPNPFYSNHVFNAKDLQRKVLKLTWGERFILRFLPTYVSIGTDCDYVFFYKKWQGRYYIIKETSRKEIIAEG